jgi:hypothetical protein
VKANVPLSPPELRQAPLRPAIEISASMCAATPPGDVTTVRPMPMPPSGFGKAMPTTDA